MILGYYRTSRRPPSSAPRGSSPRRADSAHIPRTPAPPACGTSPPDGSPGSGSCRIRTAPPASRAAAAWRPRAPGRPRTHRSKRSPPPHPDAPAARATVSRSGPAGRCRRYPSAPRCRKSNASAPRSGRAPARRSSAGGPPSAPAAARGTPPPRGTNPPSAARLPPAPPPAPAPSARTLCSDVIAVSGRHHTWRDLQTQVVPDRSHSGRNGPVRNVSGIATIRNRKLGLE